MDASVGIGTIVCVAVGNGVSDGSDVSTGSAGLLIWVVWLTTNQAMIPDAKTRITITILICRLLRMTKLIKLGNLFYLAFPWFATASAALRTASGSPR